ncbi:MAG: J domain-containing protein [Acidimicrobiia bacterium]
MTVLAELEIRHTRRHQPTRRVALGSTRLPTSGPAHGATLLAAVAAEFVGGLDEEQLDLLPGLVSHAARGLSVPRIALRYRMQTDVHGLDRSRHRIVEEPGARRILELDVHAHPAPQVIGAVMAAAALPPSARTVAMRALDRALRAPGVLPYGFEVHRRIDGLPGAAPYAPGPWSDAGTNGHPVGAPGPDPWAPDAWASVPPDRRWAMEVLGLRAEHADRLERAEIQRRFRRLVTLAHPDQGGESAEAAQRISDLAEARALLLHLLVH